MLLKNKSFVLLVLTRLIINIGDSLFYVVTLWHISSYSPLLTGVAVFCFTLPENFLVFAGPIIDRANPKKILIISNVTQILVIFVFSMVFKYQIANQYLIMLLILVSTSLSAITYPIEEVMVPQLVKKVSL